MKINAETEIYCILGNPVKHSLSPAIHNTAFEHLGLNALYCAFEPETAGAAIEAIRTLHIRGASVTIPFKVDAINHVDNLDDLARSIGALNTLVNVDGKIHGYNTDGEGALQALSGRMESVGGSRVLLIGNGGSARAIGFTLLKYGANLTVAGRNIDRVKALTSDLSASGSAEPLLLADIDSGFMQDIDVIINTTPMGMEPRIDATPLSTDLLMEKHVVFDIVYAPHKTKLLAGAEDRGCTIIYGIEMLVNQALIQLKYWTGCDVPPEVVYQALEAAGNGNA